MLRLRPVVLMAIGFVRDPFLLIGSVTRAVPVRMGLRNRKRLCVHEIYQDILILIVSVVLDFLALG